MCSLIEDASIEYKREVVGKSKSYRRFVTDFLNSHRYHDAADAFSKNSHAVNLGVMEELLTNYPEMVRRYFTATSISESDIDELLERVNSISNSSPQYDVISHTAYPSCDFESCIDPESMSLLVDCANEIHLFKERVTFLDLDGIFSCSPVRQLTAHHNGLVAIFFEGLASRGFITTTWQRVFSVHELIYSSSGKCFLNQKSLSAALYQFSMKKTPSVMRKLLVVLDRLKMMQEKPKKEHKE